MEKRIYFDNAATTYLRREAYEDMIPFLTDKQDNPSGMYAGGTMARSRINDARHRIATLLNAFDREIIFTAGGSEADNLALVGTAFALKEKGKHIITTSIEHHAVLKTCEFLEKCGFRVTYVPVEENGIVAVEKIIQAICPDTILISVMYANNEVGTIQPVEEICRIAHDRGILFHTDGVQAFGKKRIDVKTKDFDLLSASAHKFFGPKGCGFLYVKSGLVLEPLIHGGAQEYGLRAGTENVAGIIGMAKAAELIYEELDEHTEREKTIKHHLWKRLSEEIEGVNLNGDFEKSLPGILNFSVEGVEGESLMILLDMKGISASTGSACTQSLKEPSHVIKGLTASVERAKSSVRLSFTGNNTIEEADRVVDAVKESVVYLRKIRV